jgi:hypothetical protein
MNLRFLVAALGLCSGLLATASAGAAECKADKDCKATETCLGGFCYDKTRVCKTDADCKGWQTCTPGCPYAGVTTVEGGGSGGSAGCVRSDGDACSDPEPPSADAGAGGGGGGTPADAGATDQSVPECPKGTALCLADAKKLPKSDKCKAFCEVMAACEGGEGGSTPGSEPPPPMPSADGGAGAPEGPDAGGAPPPKGEVDGGGMTAPPSNEAMYGCTLMCNLMEVSGTGKAQLEALMACVAANKGSCEQVQAKCAKEGEAMEDAAQGSDLELDMMALAFGPGAPKGGGTETGGPSDNSSADGGALSAGGSADAGKATTAATASSSSSSGCTAAPVSGGMAGLGGLLLAALLLLRRRFA